MGKDKRKAAGGVDGDTRNNKRKKETGSRFSRHQKHSIMIYQNNIKGILVSCTRNKESQCVSEATTIFKQYIERLYPDKKDNTDAAANTENPEVSTEHEQQQQQQQQDQEQQVRAEEETSSADPTSTTTTTGAPAKQADSNNNNNNNKKQQEKFFHIIDSGTSGMVMVSVLPAYVDVVDLASFIAKEQQEQHQQRQQQPISAPRFRFCKRLMPIERTCAADITNISRIARELVKKHGMGRPEEQLEQQQQQQQQKPATFGIVYRCRNNETLHRTEVIEAIASQVDPAIKADLKNPEVCILVEVFKSTCGIAIARNFYELNKYNLVPEQPAPKNKKQHTGSNNNDNKQEQQQEEADPTQT